jgi:hypothetical protein
LPDREQAGQCGQNQHRIVSFPIICMTMKRLGVGALQEMPPQVVSTLLFGSGLTVWLFRIDPAGATMASP